MATAAQIVSNRANALASTGPRTATGKHHSSANAITNGLFATHDLVRPNEQLEYAQLAAAYQADLNPQGALEETYAAAIIGASWRLRRCSLVEDRLSETSLVDPMEAEAGSDAARTQRSVDRARAQAFSILRRSTVELRHLQTARTVNRLLHNQPLTHSVDSSSTNSASLCNPAQTVARNAQCPCGSGAKYKRCCGTAAAPLFQRAA
jgi:hypothetical protein